MTDSHETLNQYLDDLANSNIPLRNHIETGLVDTIRRFTEIAEIPAPNQDFVDELEDRLMNAGTRSAVVAVLPLPIHGGQPLPGFTIAHVRATRGVRRWMPMLVSAALVLVTLGFAWREFGPGQDAPNSHTGAPSIRAPATPSPDPTEGETLFEITLPADIVPHTTDRFFAIQYVTIPPGADSHWTPYWGTGPYGEYVMSGSYRERVEADVLVLRATGILEDVPANTEFTLGPGDLLISLNENTVETINDGAVSAEVLTWLFMDDPGGQFAGRNEEGWIGNNFATKGETELPSLPGAVTLRLQRMSLGPDDQVFAPLEGVQIALPLDRLTETIRTSTDSSYFKVSNLDGEPETVVYVLTLLPADSGGSAMPNSPPA